MIIVILCGSRFVLADQKLMEKCVVTGIVDLYSQVYIETHGIVFEENELAEFKPLSFKDWMEKLDAADRVGFLSKVEFDKSILEAGTRCSKDLGFPFRVKTNFNISINDDIIRVVKTVTPDFSLLAESLSY